MAVSSELAVVSSRLAAVEYAAVVSELVAVEAVVAEMLPMPLPLLYFSSSLLSCSLSHPMNLYLRQSHLS